MEQALVRFLLNPNASDLVLFAQQNPPSKYDILRNTKRRCRGTIIEVSKIFVWDG